MADGSDRDREATRTRILDAAAKVLSQDGFSGLGVNAVAREAGCDKVLIYRYFGGLEGLAEALGERLDVWLGAATLPERPGPYGPVMTGVLRAYLATLRQSPLVKRSLAWELQETTELTTRLGAAKSRAVRSWFEKVRAMSGPAPAGVDAPAINAVLIAAAHHLALREQNDGTFAGLDLTQATTWNRIDDAIASLLALAYPIPDNTDDT